MHITGRLYIRTGSIYSKKSKASIKILKFFGFAQFFFVRFSQPTLHYRRCWCIQNHAHCILVQRVGFVYLIKINNAFWICYAVCLFLDFFFGWIYTFHASVRIRILSINYRFCVGIFFLCYVLFFPNKNERWFIFIILLMDSHCLFVFFFFHWNWQLYRLQYNIDFYIQPIFRINQWNCQPFK